jgi:hypothetical protein
VASPVDILLKVGADVRDALRGIDQVDQAAKKAEQSIARTEQQASQTAQRIGQALRTVSDRGRYGLGAAAGAFAGGANLGEAAFAGLGAAFPSLGVALAAGTGAGGAIDRLQGDAAAIAEQQRILGSPTSAADAADALRKLAGRRAGSFSWGRWFRQGGDILTGKEEPLTPGQTDKARELRKAFRDLTRANPALAAQVLAEMGNPSDLARVYAEETAAMRADAARASASAAYLGGLQPASVTNVYSTFSGVGGDGAVGREVRQVLDRRERNNGRYVSTSGRRG